MNNIATFEQAKKLKNIGFNAEVHRYFLYERLISSDDYNYNGINEIHCSAPTVSEALDFIREKGITCGAGLNVNHDGKFLGDYIYEFVKENNEVEGLSGFDTHPLAESALLDAVLTYLEKT